MFSVAPAQVCFSTSDCRTFFRESRNVNSGRATASASVLRVEASPWKRCLRTCGDEFRLCERRPLRSDRRHLTVLTTEYMRERERESELIGAAEGQMLHGFIVSPQFCWIRRKVWVPPELFCEGNPRGGADSSAAPGHYNTSTPSFFTLFLFSSGLPFPCDAG